MKRLLMIGLVVVALFMLTAASPASETSALAIAGVAGIILSLLAKYVPAVGHYMVVITLAASLAVAVLAEIVTGELVLTKLQSADPATLFAAFMSAWGLSQITYAFLTQSPKTAGAVT